MSESCPTCSSPVRVVSGDDLFDKGGIVTNHYEPVMQWSRTKPTVPGWWACESNGHYALVQTRLRNGVLMFHDQSTLSEGWIKSDEVADNWNWFPIPDPEKGVSE